MNLFTKNFSENGAGDIVLRGRSFDPVTWEEIFLCAITVGRAGWRDVFHYGSDSILEMLYRYTLIIANFRESGSLLQASSTFHALDPSEKGAVSFFMGSTLAKLYAWQELDAFWMMHLDVYTKANPFCRPLPVSFNKRGVRPDLIGQNSVGEWCIVEAKGRTSGIPTALRTSSKRQAQNILSISGHRPTHIYSLCASVGGKRVVGEWIDPPETNPDGYRLEIDENLFVLGSYAPVLNLFAQLPKGEQRIQENAVFVTLPNTDLELGLDEAIYDLIRPYYSAPSERGVQPVGDIKLQQGALRSKLSNIIEERELKEKSLGGIQVILGKELLVQLGAS